MAGKDGSIFQFSRPTKDKVNTSKTFKLPPETFLLNSYKFLSVKDSILVSVLLFTFQFIINVVDQLFFD